ncbi:MAG: tetratricopeptide repeat protein [Proteobacteria bacterium]|nr:tetratricopeptide repeat protein [Pseudomonadota bacterium]
MKKALNYMFFNKIIISVIVILFIGTISWGKNQTPQEINKYSNMDEALEFIPDWQARWELARVLSYVKRYNESIAEYRKVLKEKPDLYEARSELANVLVWHGKQDEAIKELHLIPIDKTDDKTQLLIADLLVQQKDYKKAGYLYRSYLKKNPHDHKARIKLARILSWTKQYQESLDEYKIILADIPNDIQVRRQYAFVLVWAGKPEDAADELRKTLK